MQVLYYLTLLFGAMGEVLLLQYLEPDLCQVFSESYQDQNMAEKVKNILCFNLKHTYITQEFHYYYYYCVISN